MDYEKDIRIDETALDVEWLEQPRLMLKYTKHSAKMKMEVDLAKEKLESTKAEIDKDIRANPDDYDLSKVTEAAVAAAIMGDERYREANQEYLEAKYEADIAMGAVRAFEQRKDALENLVRLHGLSYFAGPRIPRDLASERELKQKRSNEAVGSTFKRREKT